MPHINQLLSKQTSKQIAQLDQENSLIVMHELQSSRNNELATIKHNIESICDATTAELKKLQNQRNDELVAITKQAVLESEPLIKALIALKRYELLIDLLKTTKTTNNFLTQTQQAAQQKLERTVLAVLNIKCDQANCLAETLLLNKQQQEKALIELLTTKINKEVEVAEDQLTEKLEFIIRCAKHEHKGAVIELQKIQKQLSAQLADIKQQAEQDHKTAVTMMQEEQSELKQKLEDIKQQVGSEPLLTQYLSAAVKTGAEDEDPSRQPSATPKLSC